MAQNTKTSGNSDAPKENQIRQWILRADIIVIFFLLVAPFGLAAATELTFFSILATPGYLVLLIFSVIVNTIAPNGFVGSPAFYVFSAIWFYVISILLAFILRKIRRLVAVNL